MASELRVTTIANNAGSESVDTTYVVNGSAKAWVRFNGTGTLAVNKSLNTSSVSDIATGTYDQNYTSSFSDAVYNYVHGAKDADDGFGIPTVGSDPRVSDTTSTVRLIYNYATGGGFYDGVGICNNIFGDLA
jgi:hypothetical protein